VLEYIKRDVANLALGNKDNHARNTALQRDFSGGVRLTPLYDFAPMYLHPDGIARRIRWEDNDAGSPDWARVLKRICELDAETPALRGRKVKTGMARVHRDSLVIGLKKMVPALHEIALNGESMGLDSEVLKHLRAGILNQAQRLATLE
jgi:serine/threonine-protein kinase HipA